MLEIKSSEMCLLIMTRLRVEGMRVGDLSGMGQEIIGVKEVKEIGAWNNGWLIYEDVQVAKNDRNSG